MCYVFEADAAWRPLVAARLAWEQSWLDSLANNSVASSLPASNVQRVHKKAQRKAIARETLEVIGCCSCLSGLMPVLRGSIIGPGAATTPCSHAYIRETLEWGMGGM